VAVELHRKLARPVEPIMAQVLVVFVVFFSFCWRVVGFRSGNYRCRFHGMRCAFSAELDVTPRIYRQRFGDQ
jgi:hypothetical protein